MLKKEWQKLIHNPILMIVIAAVVIIPTIYTTLFLGSMWDPYGKVENLPVAVVNLDREVDYEGETLNVGQALVDNLKDNDSLDFQFVDKAQAADGLADGSYYMVITIPENFSEHAATLMDDEPVKMQLDYEVNPGTNYIASKMSESALEKIKNSVAQEVTRTYAEAVFDQITEAGDGMLILGVPGEFYIQEKLMASLFGFPEFRKTVDAYGNVENMGYWLRKMEE